MTKGKTDHSQAYGDEKYWDSRYSNDAGSFDWYQRYTGLSPLVNKYVPKTYRVLMVGCGNAAISEDMVNDGYQDIVNVDISSVVIDAMQNKYLDVPQLSYIRLDVRDMKIFKDAMFDAVIDKVRTTRTLLCRSNAGGGPQVVFLPTSVEAWRCIYADLFSWIGFTDVALVQIVNGLHYLTQITYGDPRVRMSHLRARPGSKRAGSSSRVVNDPVFLNNDQSLDAQFSLDDPDLHYVYVCEKDGMIAG